CRARWVRDAAERAWPRSQEHAGFDVVLSPQPVGVAPEITRRYLPLLADLAFERGIPRLHARRVDVRVHRPIGAQAWELRVRRRHSWQRQRVSTRNVPPRILEWNVARHVNAIREGRC